MSGDVGLDVEATWTNCKAAAAKMNRGGAATHFGASPVSSALPRTLYVDVTATVRGTDASPQRSLEEEAYEQLEWAFMRLRLSSLPNIMHRDWARLQRTLCGSIAHNGLPTRELSGMHFTTEHIVSLLLFHVAYLQLVPQPVTGEDATVLGSVFWFSTVYAMLQHYTTFFLEDCRSPVRLLAARDHYAADLLAVLPVNNATPELDAFPVQRAITRACVSVPCVKALAQSCGKAGTRETYGRVAFGVEPKKLRAVRRMQSNHCKLTSAAPGCLGFERNMFAGES
ncbi:hypothetical protein CGC20_11375 [Leishmania donovani]|uniref:Uncharacterized protein n=1 Tax=Leishmania donovani TaxID=5661 RepID=A0A504Y4Z2_LEIDO|nr:hypothetical protein CGC20_11375 [Leishmania donovani]